MFLSLLYNNNSNIIIYTWKMIRNKFFWSACAVSNFSSILSTTSSDGFSLFLSLLLSSSSDDEPDLLSALLNFSRASANSVLNFVTCLFFFRIVKWRISQIYNLEKKIINLLNI